MVKEPKEVQKENEKDLTKHSSFEDRPIAGAIYDPKDYDIKRLPNGLVQIIRKKDGKVMR